MTVGYLDVLAAAGAGAVDQVPAELALAEATIHVNKFITDNLLDTTVIVPPEIHDSAILRCAVDLFSRAKVPFGKEVVADGSGQVVVRQLGADPLGGVYSLLRPWVARIGLG